MVLMVAFLALVVWLFLVRRKSDFDEAARLPMMENDPSQEEKQEHE